MPDFKDLTIPQVRGIIDPTDEGQLREFVNQVTAFSQSVSTVVNGLILAGQIQRTDVEHYRLGGPGDPVAVADGGTGRSTLTDHAVLVGSGTDPVDFVGPNAASGIPLVSQGLSADPIFGTAVVAGGGTGQVSFTDHGVLVGSGTAAIDALAVGVTNSVLQGSTGADPAFTTTPTVATLTTQSGNGTVAITVRNTALATAFDAFPSKTGDGIVHVNRSGSNVITLDGSDSSLTLDGIRFIPTSGTFNFNLPTTAGSSGQSLLSGGGGNSPMTWGAPAAGSIIVGTTTITSGTSGRILYDNAGVLGEKVVTGSGNVVLDTNPTLAGPINLTNAGGASLAYTVGTKTGSLAMDTSGNFVFTNSNSGAGTYIDLASGGLIVRNASFANSFTLSNAGNAVFTGTVQIGTSAYILSAGTAELRFESAGKTGLFFVDTGGNMAFRNETSGAGTYFDGQSGGTFFRGSGFATLMTLANSGTLMLDTYTTNGFMKFTGGTGTVAVDPAVINTLPMRLKGYTVAGLPAGTQGDTAFCTDLLLPAFLAVAAGGGAVVGPVFYNGANWVSI